MSFGTTTSILNEPLGDIGEEGEEDGVIEEVHSFEDAKKQKWEEEEDELGRVKAMISQETKAVNVLRIIVTGAMILVAAGTTYATHLYLTRQETEDFQAHYDEVSAAIAESLSFQAIALRNSFKTSSDHITGMTKQDNAKWPFFTIPDFAIHGQNLREATRTVGLMVTHDVSLTELMPWSGYTMQNGGWIHGEYVPSIYRTDPETSEVLYAISDIGMGPYQPIWEVDPLPYFPIMNYDVMPELGNSLDAIEATGEAIIGPGASTQQLAQIFPSATDFSPYPNEPYSAISQPIFASFEPDAKRVGLLIGFLRWGIYLSGILSESTRGINVVLHSETCNETNTWELVGPEAVFLGSGWKNDAKYQEDEVHVSFNLYKNQTNVMRYGACIFDIYIYPTQSFEEQYKTHTPVLVTFAVGSIFTFVVVVFFAYDWYQRRRNKKVLVSAAESNAFVSSMFPTAVRDRLFEARQEEQKPEPQVQSTRRKARKLPHSRSMDHDDTTSFHIATDSMPIADLFPSCTVFFCDICGFTAWSSVREPSQVFTLLETMYGAFDNMAKKQGVFKVETVGDCYVVRDIERRVGSSTHFEAHVTFSSSSGCMWSTQSPKGTCVNHGPFRE